MRFLVRFVRLLVRLLLWPLAALRYWRRAPAGSFVHLELDGAVDDVVAAPRFFERWRKRPLSLHGLRLAARELVADERVRGLLVTLRSFHGGMASAASLREILASVRAGGKELVFHLPLGGDTRDLYLASAASRLLVGPQATLAPLGFATRARYLKGAFEKAGIEPQVFARGAYKSAGELLVREEMSGPQREQTERILDGMHEALISALCERPSVTREKANALIDGAPYSGEAAVAVGLADAVAYDDEVAAALGKDVELVPIADWFHARRARKLPQVLPRSVLGVVRVHGTIASGSPGLFGGASEDQAISAIRAARKSRRVRGVLLHVNSPGGGALASDRIHHELEQLAKEKPLVAYLSDVAASGGYYVAAAAHEIFAQPGTITGSIGVVAARFSAEALLARLGVHSTSLQRGARAHLADPLSPLTEDDRRALDRELESVYSAFLNVVARGRKRPLEEVRAVAEGRVWTGADAHARGLVDQLGSFDAALQALRTRVGKRGATLEPAVIAGARKAGLPLDPPKEPAKALLGALLQLFGEPARSLAAALVAGQRDRVQCLSPLAAALVQG